MQNNVESNSFFDLSERYVRNHGPLLRLSYASRREEVASTDTMVNVMISAAVRNFMAGVSAKLWVSNRFFVQTLEGSSGTVESIFHRIARDPRHRDVVCFRRDRVEERRYTRPITWLCQEGGDWPIDDLPAAVESLAFDAVCESLILRAPPH